MLPFRLVYHPGYDLHLGDHIFPTQKYRLVRERLLAEGFAEPRDFVEPEPAPDEDLLRVHDPGWIRRLKTGTLTFFEMLKLELPYSREMVEAFILAAGGTTLAAGLAMHDGVGFNVGGGFHHAFPGHGEGFCALHDIAVAIRRWQHEGLIERALVVDCDVHQGNGTAAMFSGDPRVFTLSIHQFANYPLHKPASDLDIDLADQTGDQEYLERLATAYVPVLARHRPDLVIYVAGADPYCQDQLGGLALTLEGLAARDRLVLGAALERRTPVAIVLAGGYAIDVADTIAIHVNCARAARDELARTGWQRREHP